MLKTNKAVLISIRPNWCELIANGQKTIEVRKTKPKIQTPFKCYIYCTKAKSHYAVGHIGLSDDELYKLPDGQIKYGRSIKHYKVDNFLNGKVIGEFICNNIDFITAYNFIFKELSESIQKDTCLSKEQIMQYGGWKKGMFRWECKQLYGWHISELVIYDKPKSLSDFGLTRPPQSWCYIKERESNA